MCCFHNCFLLEVNIFQPRLQNRILVPLKISDKHHSSFLYSSSPLPPPCALVTWWGVEVYISDRQTADKEAEQLCF